MRGRVAPLALLVLTTLPAHAQSDTFRPWADPTLPDVLDMEEDDVSRFERFLAENPDDMTARYMLMSYHRRSDRAGIEQDRAEVVKHVLWLIEHHPDSVILGRGESRLSPRDLSEDNYQRAVALWDAAAKADPEDAVVQSNAASFFGAFDQDLYVHYLEATVAADPNHVGAIRTLAHYYADAILNQTAFAEKAQAALDASQNVWVLGNAAYLLQSLYNSSLQMNNPNPRAAEFAERYFLKAQAIDPSLDRESILPQIDMEERRRFWQSEAEAQQRWEAEREERENAGVARLRRLPVDAFPELPEAVASVLGSIGCTVPQPSPAGAPRNVIRGQFYAAGESGWAVLCSVNNTTDLLVFHNDRDTNPESLGLGNDRGNLVFLEDGQVVYSSEVTTVDRNFILRHYRAYGGPEPPPIDHNGIDSAFLEKASLVLYHYQGEWLRLQGMD